MIPERIMTMLTPGRIREKFPLQRGDVELAPVELKDAEPLFEAAVRSRKELIRWYNWLPQFSLEQARDNLERSVLNWEDTAIRDWTSLSFVIRHNGSVAGCVDLFDIQIKSLECEIGGWVDATRAGQGIGRSALHLMAQFWQTELNFRRLFVTIPIDNPVSSAVARHVGSCFTGITLPATVHDLEKGQAEMRLMEITPETLVAEQDLFGSH